MSATSEQHLNRIAALGLLVALISAPRRLPPWLRLLGGVAACLFTITAARIFTGELLLPTSSPLPFFAYPFLVATLLGWAWTPAWEGRR